MATICGIGPANQEYACIWCWCPRSLRHDTSKEWPLINGKDSCTIETITKNYKAKIHFYCRRKPLFDFIEIDCVIIDTLHLFLRITDILLENLIRQLKKEDAISKTVFNSGFDLNKHKHIKHFTEQCGRNKLQKLWSDFILPYGDLRCTFDTQDQVVNFKSKIRQWIQDFLHLYESNNVTPYMHAFYSHVPDFLKL